jgi:hypothetical protein
MNIRHLSQRELAERWTISPRTLERWRWLGVGPRFLKLGGRVVYRIADIAAFEAAQVRTRTNERAAATTAQSVAPKRDKRRPPVIVAYSSACGRARGLDR